MGFDILRVRNYGFVLFCFGEELEVGSNQYYQPIDFNSLIVSHLLIVMLANVSILVLNYNF